MPSKISLNTCAESYSASRTTAVYSGTQSCCTKAPQELDTDWIYPWICLDLIGLGVMIVTPFFN